jgi:hypothetical protein
MKLVITGIALGAVATLTMRIFSAGVIRVAVSFEIVWSMINFRSVDIMKIWLTAPTRNL